MAQRLNPPPGWPDPPGWWTPPPGWTPDPSWPEPPPGWPLWVDEDVPLPPHPAPAAADVPARVLGRAALALAAAWVVVELVGGRPWSAVVVAALALAALGVAGLALGRVRWAYLRGRPASGVLVVVAVGLLVGAQPLREDDGVVTVTDVVLDEPTSTSTTTAPGPAGAGTPVPTPAVAPPTGSPAG